MGPSFGKLKPNERKLPPREQFNKVNEYANQMLSNSTAWERLKTRKYPPKDYVELESKYSHLVCCSLIQLIYIDMHTSTDGCSILLERTAAVLNEVVMQMLLITTQHSNVLLCIKYCIEREVIFIQIIGYILVITY